MIGSGGDKAAREDMFPTQVPDWQTEERVGSPPIGKGSSFDVTTNPIELELKQLGALRDEHPGLSTGWSIVRYAKGAVVVVSRIDPVSKRELVAVFNNGAAPASARFTTVDAVGDVVAAPRLARSLRAAAERRRGRADRARLGDDGCAPRGADGDPEPRAGEAEARREGRSALEPLGRVGDRRRHGARERRVPRQAGDRARGGGWTSIRRRRTAASSSRRSSRRTSASSSSRSRARWTAGRPRRPSCRSGCARARAGAAAAPTAAPCSSYEHVTNARHTSYGTNPRCDPQAAPSPLTGGHHEAVHHSRPRRLRARGSPRRVRRRHHPARAARDTTATAPATADAAAAERRRRQRADARRAPAPAPGDRQAPLPAALRPERQGSGGQVPCPRGADARAPAEDRRERPGEARRAEGVHARQHRRRSARTQPARSPCSRSSTRGCRTRSRSCRTISTARAAPRPIPRATRRSTRLRTSSVRLAGSNG